VIGSAVDTWATVGVAVGTLGAVGYALFRDVVVLPRRRPKLELRLDDRVDDDVRLSVSNRPGKDTADDVVVVVTELRQVDSPDQARLIGLPLTWSGTQPPLTVASVHPGSERHVDLVEQSGGELRLACTPSHAGGRDVLGPGNYEISVEVRARNADAVRQVIPLSWDGAQARASTVTN
jgi:hypothetical protein